MSSKERSLSWFRYLLVVSCLGFVLSYEVDNFCRSYRLCGVRGACVTQRDDDDETNLPLKCFCIQEYYGRWCQFRDNEYSNNSNIRKDTPAAPIILNDSNDEPYKKTITISWKKPSYGEGTSILYYSIRHKQFGDDRSSSWVIKETLANAGKLTYTTVLRNVEWNKKYLVEVYAGNSHGVGKPAIRIVKRPRVSMPKPVEISEDKVGYNSIGRGNVLVLKCKADGIPVPMYSWRLNGENILEHDKRLKINKYSGELKVFNSSQEDEGFYRCLATNILGTVKSLKILVKMSVPARFLDTTSTKDAMTITLDVDLGRSFELRCPSHSRALPEEIRWGNTRHNSSAYTEFPVSRRVWIKTNGNLYFAHIEQRDVNFISRIGGIRCTIASVTAAGRTRAMSNLFMLRKRGQHITTGQIVFVTKPKDVRVILREGATLHCASKSNRPTVVRWIKGKHHGIYLNSSEKYSIEDFGRKLVVHDVTYNDVGRYTCVTYVDSEGSSESYKGDNLPEYLSAQVRTRVKMASAHVWIRGTSPRVQNLLNRTVYEGSSLQWTCQASGNPSPTVKWYHNGNLVDDKLSGNKMQIFGSTLGIENIETTNSGIYQCTADNQNGESTTAAYLDVKGIPETGHYHHATSKTPFVVKASTGRSISLTCQHLAGKFNTKQTLWFREEMPVIGNSDKFQVKSDGSLVANQLDLEDSGEYRCETNEKNFRTRRSMLLKVVNSVSGAWSSWSPWSPCERPSRSCVEHPRVRVRDCSNPLPENDGKYCQGSREEYERCPFSLCPSVSAWSPWAGWTACFPTCGHHRQRTRHRNCRVLDSMWNKCDGDKREVVSCAVRECHDVAKSIVKHIKGGEHIPNHKENVSRNKTMQFDEIKYVKEDGSTSRQLVKQEQSSGRYKKKKNREQPSKENNHVEKGYYEIGKNEPPEENHRNPPFLLVLATSATIVLIAVIGCMLHLRIKRRWRSKRMMDELSSSKKDLEISKIVELDNVIETRISPDITRALRQSSNTSIQVRRKKTDKRPSYIPPMPVISREQVNQINQVKSIETNISRQTLKTLDSKGALSASNVPPRVVHSQIQKSGERNKELCGMVNSLIDNLMESTGTHDTAQNVTPTQQQEVMSSVQQQIRLKNTRQETTSATMRSKNIRQEVTSFSQQPVRLENIRQEVTSSMQQPMRLPNNRHEVTSPIQQPVRLQTTRQVTSSPWQPRLQNTTQEVLSSHKQQSHNNDESEDTNIDVVHFVDAILMAADHGRLRHAKLVKNSPR